jgi:hypothetical protein
LIGAEIGIKIVAAVHTQCPVCTENLNPDIVVMKAAKD